MAKHGGMNFSGLLPLIPLAALLALTSVQAESGPPVAPEPQARLGINLSGPADWNTELPFVDVFRLSRAWISQREGASWGKGPALETDERGWVKRLEPGAYAETLLCTIESGNYPSGQYLVLYEGEGELGFGNAATVATQEPGRIVLDVDASKGPIFLRLLQVNPENYVRNIRVIRPGFWASGKWPLFDPRFLERWRGMESLRFMDWMHTNNSEQAKWADRPVLEDANWTGDGGVPIEVMIELSNQVNVDPWFCLPHLADDDYVRRFAQMVKAGLNPQLKVYVEFSNELWNGQFAQSRWAGRQGQALGFAEKPWEAGWRFTARRSVEIFRIWEEVFGGTERLIRVLPSQAANPFVSARIIEWEEAWKHADALAIAPYISFNINQERAAEVTTWSVDQVLDYLENEALPKSLEHMAGNKELADAHGLLLIAYEAGQHAVGIQGAENNEALTALLQAANRHPRMGQIYTKYYDGWKAAGGDLMAVFSSIGEWSKWGSWGLAEYYDQTPADSPKLASTLQWARAQGQSVKVR